MSEKFKTTLFLAFTLSALAFWSPAAMAESGFFNSNCGGCHTGVSSTCAGCHAHGVHSGNSKSDINIKGVTAKTSYAPGETVAVTISGGYRSGWVRAVLYDQNMNELARSTGPNGMGGGPGLPVTLSAPAPTSAGTYQWNVAWYGNRFDMSQVGGTTTFGKGWTPDPGNPNHGWETVSTNTFSVTAAAAPAISLKPTDLAYGTVTVGGASTQTTQIQNLGDADLNVSSISPCNGTSGEYSWSPAAPFTVSPAGSQTLSVSYAPVDATSDTGCLEIASNDPATGSTQLNLSGAGSEPATQTLDIDIARLATTKRVSLNRIKPVEIKIAVTNPGTLGGAAEATLVGVQNGTQIYNETIAVSAPAGGSARYKFPAYLPTATGLIDWSVTLTDEDPDIDQAGASTKIVK